MIEYYTSILNPDCYFVSVDKVMVATWHNTRWVDKGLYRPVRSSYYKQIEWTGTPFDTSYIDMKQFEIVKATGREEIL